MVFADPITKALKLIQSTQSAPIPQSGLTHKRAKKSKPVDTKTEQVNYQKTAEAALILYKLQFGKEANNPILYHAMALIPNPKESDDPLQKTLTSFEKWSTADPNLWLKWGKKYHITVYNTDTLMYDYLQIWWSQKSNFSLPTAKKLKLEIQFYHDQMQTLEKRIDSQITHWFTKDSTKENPLIKQKSFQSISLKSLHKLIDFQIEYIERLEFDSLMHSRDVNGLKVRHQQMLSTKKPSIQLKIMIKRAADTLEQWEFELAVSEDSEVGYRRFLAAYPQAPKKNDILHKLEGMAFEKAQQINTVESYEFFLSNQLPEPLTRTDLTFRAQFLLRTLTVNPIPIAHNQSNHKTGFFYADSITLQPWLELNYKMAYPYALNNNKNSFVENGATLIPGCALIMKTDTFGLIEFSYISKDGKPFTKNSYETIYQFSSRMAFVQRGGRWGILNYHGKEILPCKFENLRYDTAEHRGALKTGNKWALFNTNGKLITAPKYDAIGFETWENEPTEAPSKLWVRNRCAAQINGSWALIDTLGNALTPFAYTSMSTLPYGRFMGKINAGYCLWRDTIQCSAEYSEAVDFGKPYTLIQQKGWGIIDTLGRILVPPIYEKALLVGSTVALLKNKKWNFFYSKGEFSLPIKGAIEDFRMHGDGMVFAKQKKNWILYHAFTKTVRKIKSIDLQQLTDTLLLEPIGNNWFITHANGKILLPDTLISLSRINDHEWLATQNSGTGLLCLPSMQWTLKPLYQEIIMSQKSSQFMVKKNEKWGVVNNFGEMIVPMKYDAITDTEFPEYWYALKNENTVWIDASGRELSE